MFITNNPYIAIIAQKCGVERIWIDLETLGKEQRQKNLDSVKSKHTIADIKAVSKEFFAWICSGDVYNPVVADWGYKSGTCFYNSGIRKK